MDLEKKELLEKISKLELENSGLRKRLEAFESPLSADSSKLQHTKIDEDFTLDEYKRYGRQMIVPSFGSRDGQVRLKHSKVLVIGAGGLGCPALLYLSAAGVGKIGIIDDDVVDTSNLHRQVLHTTDSVGIHKCESAKRYISRLNPHVQVETYPYRLTNSNAFDIINKYDVIMDCTDTPATRYLINDVSVLCSKPIVSASGLKTEGQLTILNFKNMGPCYRCFYPKPPKPETVTTCTDGGVIGPAIGLMGITMALEAIKLITGYYTKENFKPFLAQYSGYPQQTLRVFKMRNKQHDCAICSPSATITKEIITNNEIDYASFCGKVNTNILDSKYRVSVRDFHENNNPKSVLLDVRPPEQFQITKLPNSINISWDPILTKADNIDEYFPDDFDKSKDEVYVLCRYGNDSQLAAKKLIEELGIRNVKDIKGGINKWSEEIDSKIPKY